MLVPSMFHCGESLLEGPLRRIIPYIELSLHGVTTYSEQVIVVVLGLLVLDGTSPLHFVRVDLASETAIYIGSGPFLKQRQ